MKALLKFAKGPGNVEIREVPEPDPAENQVKLAVSYCGICGTDLHVRNDTFRNFPPVILGHEFCGRVVERGRGVSSVHEGDRFTVLGASTVTCGHCVYCRQGEFMFCPERRGMGHGVNGAFAPFVVARPDQLFKLPNNLPDDEGALCEPFAAAVHAVCDLTQVRLGDVAVVSGSGPIGLLCLKLLVAQGIKTLVFGTAQDKGRLQTAKQMGAALAVDVTLHDPIEVVRSETDGFGADVVFECAGAAASARTCFEVVRPLGSFTQVGHFGGNVELNFDKVAFKQLRVNGSVGYNAATWTRMLKMLSAGTVKLGDMISHRLPMEKWPAAFKACEDKSALKVLLDPRGK
jgi:L-iditol 2-dehydrogenase